MTTISEQGKTESGLDEMIVVSGLSIYGVELADLRVRRGEVVALVGPNGSGKSTVSRVVVGALQAMRGSSRVLGLDPIKHAAELKRRVGYLVKDLETMGSLTSRDVLDICAAVRGCTISYARELADRLRLELDRPMANLSRGQLRRLGVAQALMHRPEVIVLDDPFTDLDEPGRHAVALVLREATADGAAVLVTANSPTDVDECADRIVAISRLAVPASSPAAMPDPGPLPVDVEPEPASCPPIEARVRRRSPYAGTRFRCARNLGRERSRVPGSATTGPALATAPVASARSPT